MQIEKVHMDGVHEFATMLCFDGKVLKIQMAVLGLWKDNKVGIEGHWCGGTKAPSERMGAEEWVCVRQGQGRSRGGGFSEKEDEELGWGHLTIKVPVDLG